MAPSTEKLVLSRDAMLSYTYNTQTQRRGHGDERTYKRPENRQQKTGNRKERKPRKDVSNSRRGADRRKRATNAERDGGRGERLATFGEAVSTRMYYVD
jgi:hypothetical protein